MNWLPRPIDLINKSTGLAGLRIARDIAYGPHPRQLLDLYAPARAWEKLPVIVFFYGGSWQTGDRADFAFVAATLARRGFAVAVPDYRTYPEVKFPTFLEDSAAAVAWVFDNIGLHHGNADEVFLLGHSAGAYNAVMLALAPGYLAAPRRLAGVIGLSGPYDFLPLKDPAIKDIFAPPADIKQTQPITFARGDAPPLFLATGARDITVMPRNTTALAARLRQMGGVVETKIYPNLGHIGIILSLLPFFAWRAPVLRDVLEFCTACRTGALNPAHSENRSGVVG